MKTFIVELVFDTHDENATKETVKKLFEETELGGTITVSTIDEDTRKQPENV